jgi:hypothetical protein
MTFATHPAQDFISENFETGRRLMITRYMLIVVLCAHFSAVHGQLVAADEPGRSEERQAETSPALTKPFLESALDGVSKFGAITRQMVNPATKSDGSTDGQPYVWIRMSKGYLAKHVEREVDRQKPARDQILGITFTGTSRTTGATRLILHPSDDGARGHVVFEGKIQSRTTGRKGPATLDYLSNSTFRASKPLAITESGLTTGPAKAEAPTTLTPLHISTSLPGLRDRIARRIAWRRAAASQAEADAIASEHRTRDIGESLDQRLSEVVATIQAQLQSQLNNLELADGGRQLSLRSRSTPEFVEVVLVPARLEPHQFKMPEFQVAENTDVGIRVHKSTIARVMTNPRLRDKLAAVAAGLVQSQVNLGPTSNRSNDQPLLAIDSEWFAFDVSAPAAVTPNLQVAEASTVRQRLP